MPTTGLGPDGVLDAALAQFMSAMQSYLPELIIWGVALLSAVVFAGFAYALFLAILNHDWFGMLMGFGFAAVRVAIIYMVYQNFEALGTMFPTMGQVIGQAVSGQSPNVLTPSGFYTLGLNIVSLLFKARHFGAWFNVVADGEFLLVIILTMLTWFAAASRYMFTLIECEWFYIKGAVTVCFSAFPNTFNTLENWAVQMLRVGIRLIATLLILAIGLIMAQVWTAGLSALGIGINTNPVAYGATQLAEAALVFWAIWKLPQKADHLIVSQGSAGSALEPQPGREFYDAVTRISRTITKV